MARAVLTVLGVVLAIPAYAGFGVDGCESYWGVSCSGMRVSICPLGDFEPLREGCGGENDYIWIYARDRYGASIPGIPTSDYWIEAADPAEELCLCADPIAADSVTNDQGRTTISGCIAGGGCLATGGVYLKVQGVTILDIVCISPHIEYIEIVSPDINADCRIDLSDFTAFSLSYNKDLGDPGYDTCCDFNDDDCCNIRDYTWLGLHYYHECIR